MSAVNTDTDTILEALNDKLDRDGNNLNQSAIDFDVVVEWQIPTATNDYTWYRKYASGWVEQGQYGHIQRTAATTTINLLVTMASDKYTVLTNGTTATTYQSLSTTSFNLITTANQYAGWMVSGMAAA